ncbi:flavin reductase [Variovorax paradoxus]|jgi:flavin reductase (DIM6/NTAB) family NADH-FMN oxidoreductase RutF|uniref:flavin reductase n=1 Tax=Variovorax TaxID=34072 RepID=UPI0006E5C5F4|nr:flavin reductase [Variovorax paradoxus]KPV11269.1 flavin reductase [Variovorax paradoxus]KPV13177.1 flavin reductase [Variovorax paradoxus]KPV19580.1 flavin reductase [Variovorax paradoxus]KPV28013.1 flavin reductase [Variovorax paradoxus]
MEATATFEPRQLRDVLGTFVTGVTVVTTRAPDGQTHGVTANSFSSVSLDPPLVLWSQSLSSRSHSAFQDSGHFAINILADDQIALSNHFAKSRDDKFDGIAHAQGVGGVPVLEGVAAHLECTKIAAYPGGDHVVFMGRVERIAQSGRRPLAFGRGKYMVAYAHDLGPTALRLGTSRPVDLQAIRTATAALPAIAERLGQHTLCLAVWGNHGPTAVHWEPSRRPVSDQLRPGLVMSITRSATGRAFAAFLPEEMTRPMIEEDLHAWSQAGESAAERRARFDATLTEARARGLARAIGDAPSPIHQVAVNAFSAPILDAEGHMVMALSLTSDARRLSSDWDAEVPRGLLSAAREISRQIA